MTAPSVSEGLLFSIVMPAYNEEEVLAATVQDLTVFLDRSGFRYELIIVDDASADRTGEVARAMAAAHPAIRPIYNNGPNGYGQAIRKGLEHYRGDAAVVVTSDGADAPKDVAAFFELITEGYDCAFGERFGKDSTVVGYPRLKRVVNRLANWLLGLLTGSRYRDFTNGFKCYRREVIDEMQPLRSSQFNITIEMSLKAVLAGRSIAVVPNDWHQRDAGQSSFKILRLIKPYAATMLYCLTRSYLIGQQGHRGAVP